MSIRRRKHQLENNILSFIDVISCGFGAIVLLLLIVKTTAPESIEDSQRIAEMQAKMMGVQQQQEVQDEIDAQEQKLQDQRRKLAQILERLGENKKAFHDSGVAVMVQEKVKGQMELALQSLDAEMRMLKLKRDTRKVGGIPADSRHVIFIIDTSGSMQGHAWHKVQEQMSAILDAYPQIEGLQVMNDMGEHLFEGYRGRWIKDTKTTRDRILRELRNWQGFSNSNPVEGIYDAISIYAPKTKSISIYIMGDDFSGSIEQVLDKVNSLIKAVGAKKVRVHAIGFFTPGVAGAGFFNFARLSELTRKNRGTFVGISTR